MTGSQSSDAPGFTGLKRGFSHITVDGRWFKDDVGRVLLLRGVNLSGNTKTPAKPLVTSFTTGDIFFEHQNVSFIGRPLPLDEVDEHLERLKSWGFQFLRFLVTWEALEHAGPGVYDEDYIDYVVTVLERAKSYGFRVFIDPHQDVWSRFSGGSGAPFWTLEAVGLDPRKFKATNAAIVHNTWCEDGVDPLSFPKMIWASNYNKYAAATMFTLFFGGNTFAPNKKARGTDIPIQDFLQGHYIAAIAHLASRIQHIGVVVGYDTLNEPSCGFIGDDIREFPHGQLLKSQICPTPFQSMMLASGIPTNVDWFDRTWYGGIGKSASVLVNKEGIKAFLDDCSCVWEDHGVWQKKDGNEAEVHLPLYFVQRSDGSKYEFKSQFWLPFVASFSQAIRQVDPNTMIFVEPPVNEVPPKFTSSSDKNSPLIAGPVVFAPHWYDGLTLFNKRYAAWNIDVTSVSRGHTSILGAIHVGESSIRRSFVNQIGLIKKEGLEHVGEYPCLIGETGIPFDMHDKEAYHTNDYSKQIQAMDATLSAMDANLVNYTIWNYCPDNENIQGDFWNGEDFSIYSRNAPPAPAVANSSSSTQPEETTEDLTQSTLMTAAETTQQAATIAQRRISSFFNVLALPFGITPRPTPSAGSLNPFFRQVDKGGRALNAVIRPYAMKVAGEPTKMSFDISQKVFYLEFTNTSWLPGDHNATEIFLPHYHYGSVSSNFVVEVSDGLYLFDPEEQLLVFKHGSLDVQHHFIRISRV